MIHTNRLQQIIRSEGQFIGSANLPGLVRLVLVIAAFFFSASICSASVTNVYIAQNSAGAANGADCADAQALSWFSNAANWGPGATQIGPGTTVHLCGTFIGSAGGQAISVNGSGSSGNPITIKFETGANLTAPFWGGTSTGAITIIGYNYIVVDGGVNGIIQNTDNGTGLGNHAASTGVVISKASNITVKNLTIANICQHTSSADTSGCSTSGVGDEAFTFGGTSNVTITRNTIHDTTQGIGYWWRATDSGNVISWNTISRTNWGIASGGTGAATNALTVNGNDISCVVGAACNWNDNADIFHHNGIMIYPQGSGNILQGVVISNNFIHDINTCTAGIFLDPGNSADVPNAQIFNNVFYTTPGQVGPSNAWIQPGAISSNPLVVNNTVIGPASQGIAVQINPTIENNIVTLVGYGVVLNQGYTTPSINYNDYYSNYSPSLARMVADESSYNNFFDTVAAWTATYPTFDTHSITRNPNLTSGFMLNSGSPAIGAGKNLTSLGIAGLDVGAPQTFGVNGGCGTGCSPRPTSGPWDIGAYQTPGVASNQPNPATALSATGH